EPHVDEDLPARLARLFLTKQRLLQLLTRDEALVDEHLPKRLSPSRHARSPDAVVYPMCRRAENTPLPTALSEVRVFGYGAGVGLGRPAETFVLPLSEAGNPYPTPHSRPRRSPA